MQSAIISEDLTIEGDLTGTSLTILGRVGDVSIDVQPTGEVSGTLSAETVSIGGRVKGRVTCADLTLTETARVEADLVAGSLTSRKGATLAGKVEVRAPKPGASAAPADPAAQADVTGQGRAGLAYSAHAPRPRPDPRARAAAGAGPRRKSTWSSSSPSTSPGRCRRYELEIQRRGYAEALTSDEVLSVIADGFTGADRAHLHGMGGDGATRVVVDWTVIAGRGRRTGRGGASRACALRAPPHLDLGRDRHGRGGSLRGQRLHLLPAGDRRLGRRAEQPRRPGRPRARRGAGAGIVINGLPLMTRDAYGGMWHLDDLDTYYLECVIGGPGAFVIPVRDWSEFPAAVRRKLVLEIAGLPPPRPRRRRPRPGRRTLRLPDRRADLGAQPRPVGLAVARARPLPRFIHLSGNILGGARGGRQPPRSPRPPPGQQPLDLAPRIRLTFAPARQPMGTATLTIDLDAVVANWRALDALSGRGHRDRRGREGRRLRARRGARGARARPRGGAAFFVAVAEEGAAVRTALGPGPDIFVFSGHMGGDTDTIADMRPDPDAQLGRAAHPPFRGAAGPSLRHPARHRHEPARDGARRMGGGARHRAARGAAARDEPPRLRRRARSRDERAAAVALRRDDRRDRRAAVALGHGGHPPGPRLPFRRDAPGRRPLRRAPLRGGAPRPAPELPVVQVRDLAPGETVGYANTWAAPAPARIATVSAGYADGLLRALSGRRRSSRATPPAPSSAASRWTSSPSTSRIWTRPRGARHPRPEQGIDRLAEAAGTIGYEILTSLGSRYRRRYAGGARMRLLAALGRQVLGLLALVGRVAIYAGRR
jgi:alanine racemase